MREILISGAIALGINVVMAVVVNKMIVAKSKKIAEKECERLRGKLKENIEDLNSFIDECIFKS